MRSTWKWRVPAAGAVMILAAMGAVWALDGGHANIAGLPPACGACHTPHFAKGAVLWSRTPDTTAGGSTMFTLCYSCHDGDVTSVGSTTAFDLQLDQHPTEADVDNHDCDRCHDPHRTKPDGQTSTPYLREVNGDTSAFCTKCHVDKTCAWDTIAAGHGEITNMHSHPCVGVDAAADGDAATIPSTLPDGTEAPPGEDLELTANDSTKCETCHKVHGAPAWVNDLPILRLPDRDMGTNNADLLCGVCHDDKW